MAKATQEKPEVFLIKENPKKSLLNLDPWQKEVLAYKGNIVVCSGRQTGKSTVVAIKAAEFVVNNPLKQVLIISVTEDQARELLQKAQLYIEAAYPRVIKTGKSDTNKEKCTLKNGSIIRTKAVGQSGLGVRGFTIDMLIADEAGFMPEDVWPAVTPMLSTTGGDIVLLSTPHGRKGYFFNSFNNPDLGFKVFYVNSVENAEKREISETWPAWRKEKHLQFIASERARMSVRQFAQEYLGQFVDADQFFPDDIIRKSMLQQRMIGIGEGRDYFLGVDVARMGDDKCTFEIIERKGMLLIHRESLVWKKVLLSEVTEKIKMLHEHWKFRRIYIDDGGIGVGVFDNLYSTPGMKKIVTAINNSQRVYDYNPNGTPKAKKLLKEDLYNNLLHLMETGKILILDDGDIWQSFKSIQFEYMNEKGGATIRIYGSDSHIVEGLIRAAWCVKEKINNFRISYI